ncbi:MAG: (Fe-S)-binding protein [Candidatus Thorarchaeota archaeon]
MSSIWTRTWKATPKVDCGLCGLPNCASFGRAIMFGECEIEACPILKLNGFANLKTELKSTCSRAPDRRAKLAPEQPEGGVLFTRPCKDTDEKVMAELRIFNGVETGEPVLFGVFDPRILCELMDCMRPHFDLVKCSRDLGYGRADLGEMSITVLQDGRINMRRVDDREAVMRLFERMERVLIGATVCNSCGRDLLSILLDGKLSPHEDVHVIIGGGSSLEIDKSTVAANLTRSEFYGLSDDCLIPILESFESLIGTLRERTESILGGQRVEVDVDKLIQETRQKIVTFLLAGALPKLSVRLLKLIAILREFEMAFIGLTEIAYHIDRIPNESSSMVSAWLENGIQGIQIGALPEIQDEDMILIFAHMMKIARLFGYLTDWV